MNGNAGEGDSWAAVVAKINQIIHFVAFIMYGKLELSSYLEINDQNILQSNIYTLEQQFTVFAWSSVCSNMLSF